jgi:hypothetical protein
MEWAPKNQPSREKVTQGGLPNGNEEEGHEESRQEEKAVTDPARHWRLTFAQTWPPHSQFAEAFPFCANPHRARLRMALQSLRFLHRDDFFSTG